MVEERHHPDLSVESPVTAFRHLKNAVAERRPLDLDALALYEGLEWLAESLRELHFKADRIVRSLSREESRPAGVE